MTTLSDIRSEVIRTVREESGRLSAPADYDRSINVALGRYSKHRPAIIVADVAGNGTNDLSLPVGWISEFSTIEKVEYPIGQLPASELDNDDYVIYQTPLGERLRLTGVAPSSNENVRVTFTALRAVGAIPANDLGVFILLAASFCCEELSNAYAYSSRPTIGADSVDYQSRSREFAARARALRQLYKDHMGLKDDDSSPPASAVTDLDIGYPGGRDRLTHPRIGRERR